MARSVSFIVVTAVLVSFQAASSAPAPLYVVYQHSMRFSAATLTLVFAVFAFALVVSLLVLGGLSDHVGRRPVLATAIALECLALLRGLYLSLGSSVAVGVFGIANHLAGGVVVALLCGTGAVAAVVVRGCRHAVVTRLSVTMLVAGTTTALLGTLTGSVGVAVAGTVASGVGYGWRD